jgi:hypothetical protein
MLEEKCYGYCFKGFEEDFYLPFWIKEEDSKCGCTLIKCPNYDICKSEYPEFLISCFRGHCENCDTRRFSNNDHFTKKSDEKEECPICLENNYLYKLIECNHYLCGNCVHKLYYTNYGKLEDYPIRPPFPYNNCDKCEDGDCKCENYNEYGIHNYFENENDPKWLLDEKIQEWKKKDIFFKDFCKNYIKEPVSNECPFCRKKQNYFFL